MLAVVVPRFNCAISRKAGFFFPKLGISFWQMATHISKMIRVTSYSPSNEQCLTKLIHSEGLCCGGSQQEGFILFNLYLTVRNTIGHQGTLRSEWQKCCHQTVSPRIRADFCMPASFLWMCRLICGQFALQCTDYTWASHVLCSECYFMRILFYKVQKKSSIPKNRIIKKTANHASCL